jgi:hypothetical protein
MPVYVNGETAGVLQVFRELQHSRSLCRRMQ